MTALDDALAAADAAKAELAEKAKGTNKTGVHLLPGETEAQAIVRRVKFHEFMMTGGIQQKELQGGKVVYSKPITLLDALDIPECPWHGSGCDSWIAIRRGEGYWTKLEAELAEVEATLAVRPEGGGSHEPEVYARYNELRDELSLRPRDLTAIRERTDEEFKAERRAALKKANAELNANTGGVYAKAGPKTGGNPWDKKTDWDKRPAAYKHPASGGGYVPKSALPVDDARDDAVAAFALGAPIPDSIEIEGDEEDE